MRQVQGLTPEQESSNDSLAGALAPLENNSALPARCCRQLAQNYETAKAVLQHIWLDRIGDHA